MTVGAFAPLKDVQREFGFTVESRSCREVAIAAIENLINRTYQGPFR
jgi:hypothetical protein